MHHLMSTGLCCALSTRVVHHQPALCTMVHKGDLCPSEVEIAANINHFLMGHKEHAKNGHFLSVFGGARARGGYSLNFCMGV